MVQGRVGDGADSKLWKKGRLPGGIGTYLSSDFVFVLYFKIGGI